MNVKITAVRKHSLGIKGTVSPRKKKTHASVVSTGLQSPLPEPLNSSSISIESLGFPAKPEPEKPAQTPPKPPTSQKRKHGIVKKVRRPIERPQPVKKAPEPAPKASSPEPEPVETPVSTETPDSEAPPLPKATAVIPDLPVLKSKEKTKAERKQSRSRRALIFNTNEPYINPELLEQMDSDQKLKKQMDNQQIT
ncbi:uncharacterized protein LOC135476452 [Liolophura sinensis]|uniref:uncharacterized protein LOC135476452 n=1 Tax=Liolophura sinensis TaxID=3198878 RepID=UPI003158603E